MLYPEENCSIGVWKIEESLDDLIELSQNKYEVELLETSNIERKKQRLISRILLANMLEKKHVSISYDKNRKPYLRDHKCSFSISHTSDYVVVSLAKIKKTGVDIEKLTDRILRIETRFISEVDSEVLGSAKDDLKAKYLVWGAKECMLKYVGDRKIDFKRHMQIKSFNFTTEGSFSTKLSYKHICEEFQVHYLMIEDHVLSYIFK